ncbi:type 4a pilus biogenesis protein PilO [Candidatus Parcubacteria bacterium]|nr:type 4a pilus biogenesis protein PilO [Candidatus Parcubacteria bacterium]
MKKPIISITIISLAVVLLTFFVILPKYEELNSKNLQVEEKRFEFDTLEEYFRELSLKYEELGKYESEMAKIDSALPDNPNIASVFYFIQNMAEENGISLISVSLTSSPIRRAGVEQLKESDVKENRFFVNVAGSYSSFKDFLSALEKSARLIEVEEISFSSFRGMERATGAIMPFSPSEDVLFFDLQMKVYSY